MLKRFLKLLTSYLFFFSYIHCLFRYLKLRVSNVSSETLSGSVSHTIDVTHLFSPLCVTAALADKIRYSHYRRAGARAVLWALSTNLNWVALVFVLRFSSWQSEMKVRASLGSRSELPHYAFLFLCRRRACWAVAKFDFFKYSVKNINASTLSLHSVKPAAPVNLALRYLSLVWLHFLVRAKINFIMTQRESILILIVISK